MQWVFDQLVEWILENLASCFSVLSDLLFTFFNLDRSTFDTFFSFFGSANLDGNQTSLYQLFMYFGYAISMAIVLLRLLKNFFAVVDDTDYEDPIKLIFRAIGAFVLVAISGNIIDYEFRFVGKPYELVSSMMNRALDSAGGMNGGVWDSLSESLRDGLQTGAGNAVVTDLITIGCLIAIFFGYLKLALEVAERYVVICVSIYLSPLAFSTAASKGTVKIMNTYIRMVFCQLLLMIFNVIFVDGTIIAIYHYVDEGGVLLLNNEEIACPTFIFCILLMAFITAGQKMDAYMRGLGLDVVQTGSLFDEIRSGMTTGMLAMRSMAGAVRAAGGIGKAVAGGLSRISGTGARSGGRSGGRTEAGIVKEAVAGAARSARASVTQTVAQNHASVRSVAQKAAQSQIKLGGFDGVKGETSKSIAKATETAMGAEAFTRLGIVPSSLSGKNGMIDFKAENGAAGTLSFEKKNGNGWKELTDENGKGTGTWIKGTSNLGISDAQTGTRQNIAQAFGEKGADRLRQIAKDRVDASSLEAISLGNGEFSIVGQSPEGISTRLGRVIPAESGEKISGASVLENEFGGKVGFLPETDINSAMNGRTMAGDGLIGIGDAAVPADAVREALAPLMEAGNIAEGTALVGFSSDGDTFAATFADPVTGTKDLQGNVAELMSGIDRENIRTADDAKQWIGMNDMFDTCAYTAVTGETPKEIAFCGAEGSQKENGTGRFIVTNESGSKYVLDQASATGKYGKVISGGDVFENVPFSIQKNPRNSQENQNNKRP